MKLMVASANSRYIDGRTSERGERERERKGIRGKTGEQGVGGDEITGDSDLARLLTGFESRGMDIFLTQEMEEDYVIECLKTRTSCSPVTRSYTTRSE